MSKRKKIIILIISIILVIGLVIGAICAIKYYQDKNNPKNLIVTVKKQAETINEKASDAADNQKADEAIRLYKEAEEKYREAGDVNNMVNAQTQAKIIEYFDNKESGTATETTERKNINNYDPGLPED